jgi:hypothetical protein
MSDDELQNELIAADHDEASRNAIIGETLRRISRARTRPNWVQWLTLACAIVAALLSAIAALPAIENLGESRWFDF